MTTVLPLLHPILGATAVAALFFVGLRGLRSRRKQPDAAASRAFHRRWTPLALGLVVASFLGGVGSVYFLRDDLDSWASWHARFAAGLVGMLTALWYSSPLRTNRAPPWTRAHVTIGFFAMLAAILTAALGLGLLP
jgi:hypothetical protein